jgi:hypothetical protein
MASSGAIPPPIAEVPEDQKFDSGVKTTWISVKRRITNALKTQGLYGYADGTIIMPSVPALPQQTTTAAASAGAGIVPATVTPTAVYSTSPSLEEWTFRNDRAKGIIESYIDDLPSLLHGTDEKTAREVMVGLEAEYGQKDDLIKVMTERKLRTYMFNGSEPLDEFFKNLRSIRREAVQAGNEIDDPTFRQIVLAAFPGKEFDGIISNITSAPNTYTTSSSVIQQIAFSYSRIEERSNAAASGSKITAEAHAAVLAKVEELEKKVAAAWAKGQKSDVKCSNCGRTGHLAADCFRKGGGKEGQYPSWWKGKKDTDPPSKTTSANTSVGHITQSYALSATSTSRRRGTYADSAASDHFFREKADFLTYTPCSREGQSSELETPLQILGVGRVRKVFTHEGHDVELFFENALHCPNITYDLVSISEIDKKGYRVEFGGGLAKFYSPDGIHFLTGIATDGLYLLPVRETAGMAARSLRRPVDIKTWHRRFGHVGMHRLDILRRNGLVDGLDIVGPVCVDDKCEDCLVGKAVRRPFDGDVERETEILERVHTDLTGPMRTTAIGGYLYSMPVVDGHTALTKDFYLKTKDGATTLEAMEQYQAEAEAETGKKMKRVRVDGGGEFTNDEWKRWARKHGIQLEIIPAYSSSANGVAERKHGTTFARVRAILHDSGLPKSLWVYAVAYVTYTDNLLPSARANNQIPAQLWTGKRQDVSHLRPFGARGWATIVNGGPGRLDDQAVEGRMIGYGERGTYLLYTKTGAVIRSRDVNWEEGRAKRTRTLDGGEDEIGELLPTSAEIEEIDRTEIDNDKPRENENEDPTPVHQDQTRSSSPDNPTATADPPQTVNPPRRSTRAQTLTKARIRADETLEREREAREAGEEWAKNSKRTRPRANLTVMMDSFSEADYRLNEALVAIGLPPVPKSFNQAMEDPSRWTSAIDSEKARMEEFRVFGPLQEKPENATVLVPLWVFAHKLDGNGNIIGEKARLVVNGGRQKEGLDYSETFAAVMRYESLRVLVAFWVVVGHFIWQIDFSSAYLNAELKEEIYVHPPEGFPGRGSGMVMRLKKSIYGTMQAGHNWWEKLDNAYKSLGYTRSKADQCVRTRISGREVTTTGTYTDDTFGGSSSAEEMKRAKAEIGDVFRIKETDNIQFALGMRLTHDREQGIATLSMEAYWDRLLARHNFQDLKPKSTPLPIGSHLSVKQAPSTHEDIHFMRDKRYAEILGGIQFGQAACRPDLTYSTNVLSRFIQNPGRPHWNALVHLLRYIIGTKKLGITYSRNAPGGLNPITFADSDYAACVDTRRSTMGVVTMMAGGPTFWMSKRQDVVALSTTEAEYIALGKGAQQARWTHNFLTEIGHPEPLPSKLLADNKGAIAISENPRFHSRVKHIDIRFHYLRDVVEKGAVKVEFVASEDNPADLLTKSLGPLLHRRQVKLIGLGEVEADRV